MDGPRHILVVDDNDDVRDVIVTILEEHQYRVSTASGGFMMRDFLEADDTVDCVVLDALMPGEAGVSLALYLKERGTPVVMISGSPEVMKAAADNGQQLLPKPFRSQELYSAIHTALASGKRGQQPQADG
jgi:DNA-binding NtrC family response regulator